MPEAHTLNLRITRLRLVNWRNFREVDIKLADRAFIVGPNASGKSNLLDALRFLGDLVHPSGGGLRSAVERRGGLSKLRCLHARKINHVEIDVDLGDNVNPTAWGYRVRFAATGIGKARLLSVVEEEIRRNDERQNLFARPDNPPDPQAYTQTRLQQVTQNQAFRPIADFFVSIRYLHVVPQVVRDLRRARTDEEDPFGGDLLRRMKEMPKKNRTPRLARLGKALKIAVPQFDDLELEDDSEGHPHLYARFNHWRNTKAKQSEETFSDGTLRLIGFLWSITEKGGPLLLEEPELSLNDAVVSQLPGMIHRVQTLSRRQVIATSHSSALLNADGVGLQEAHIITVDENGSHVETASDSNDIVTLVSGGWPIGEAVLSLTNPKNVDQLSRMNLVSG